MKALSQVFKTIQSLPIPDENKRSMTNSLRVKTENKKPKSFARHVGIEIECNSAYPMADVYFYLKELKLDTKISITYDGSVSGYNAMELRILDTEKNISKTLEELVPFFKKIKAKVNNSCGLHVHLDMRRRNAQNCYKNLLNAQKVMMGLVSATRVGGEYCEISSENTKEQRYSAINYGSLRKHKTLEIRLHQGSVNPKEINTWVQFLLKALKTTKKAEVLTDVISSRDKLYKDLKKKWNKRSVAKFDRINAREERERIEFLRRREQYELQNSLERERRNALIEASYEVLS